MVREAPGDEQLLARQIERDTQAFCLLYERHSRPAYGLALRLVGDPSLAEDVVQAAFLSLWHRAATIRPGQGEARPWLLSMVHRHAGERVRRGVVPAASDPATRRGPDPVDE